MQMFSLVVGERLLVDGGEPATVRYVGDVAGTQGTWAGVEFDRAGRGKHDGAHGGVRYFQCAAEGQNASFVRPAKLQRGVSILEALNIKYRQACSPFNTLSFSVYE